MTFDFMSGQNSFVCVFREEDELLHHIVYSIDLKETVSLADKTWRLVYIRQFGNVVDGLAHRLLLLQLSPESVREIIRNFNPKIKDLRPLLMMLAE